jgi:hypothetical protein
MSFVQLAAMDGADYGALASDIRRSPPVCEWLPAALADVLHMLGCGENRADMLRRWGFEVGATDVADEDRRFLEAMQR